VVSSPRDWQESTLLDFTEDTPAQRFMRMITELPPRTRFTVNDLRDRLDAAEVPNRLRGGLMSAAVAAHLIEAVTVAAWNVDYPVRVPSTGLSAKRATVRVYRRVAPPAADPAGGTP
jgi:hypothetical protein